MNKATKELLRLTTACLGIGILVGMGVADKVAPLTFGAAAGLALLLIAGLLSKIENQNK